MIINHTKLFSVWAEIHRCDCVSVSFEMPFKRWILLKAPTVFN